VRRVIRVAVIAAFLLAPSSTAWADVPNDMCDSLSGVCEISRRKAGDLPRAGAVNPDSDANASKSIKRTRDSDAIIKFNAEWNAYQEGAQRFQQCIRESVTSTGPRGMCANGPPPPDPNWLLAGFNPAGGLPAVQISPAQAGAIAVARLQLPTVAPGIGPSPDLNRWKMAAVGYPLWLWADGPTQVGPVSDSVAGLSVSLRAEVSSLTFRMGDGNTINCQGDGDEWTEAVKPGAQSPSCGYTYTEPSLPKGNYTIAALTEWAVTWTANGQSGVINVPAVQTTELPVGELQVLVR
jgi:hypothetical protein